MLLIGTGDTKSDELAFMSQCLAKASGIPASMDVSVLGEPKMLPAYSKHDVAAAAGTTIDSVIKSGDENSAMALMASGAS